jgi:hypothetical protein
MINGGGHCNRLQSKVTVNRDFTEAVSVPTSINQTGKIKKKEKPVNRPAEPIHEPDKPIHGPLLPQPLARTWTVCTAGIRPPAAGSGRPTPDPVACRHI